MGFVYPYIVPIVMTLSWLFAVAHCIKTLTAYRESGLEEVRCARALSMQMYALQLSLLLAFLPFQKCISTGVNNTLTKDTFTEQFSE